MLEKTNINLRYIEANDTVTNNLVEFHILWNSEILAMRNSLQPMFLNECTAFQFFDNYTNNSRIKNIEIKTLTDYNNNFEAGSSLLNIIQLASQSHPEIPKTNIADFIELHNSSTQTYSEKTIPSGRIYLTFTEEPILSKPQQFTIEFEMEDGRKFSDTSVIFIPI